jgi:hypothetical protein
MNYALLFWSYRFRARRGARSSQRTAELPANIFAHTVVDELLAFVMIGL